MPDTEANRRLLHEIYDGLAAGSSRLFLDHLSHEVVWTVKGRTPWSRTYRGRETVLNELLRPLRARLADRYRAAARRILADGEYVVVEARGDCVTTSGMRYDNEYCFVYRLQDGRISEVVEYMDSALVNEALGDP